MTAAVQQQAPLSRMTLGAITRGKIKRPRRIVVFGPDGVGKTTFAANAPKPIFIGAEQGTDAFDVPRFPPIQVWPEVLEAVRALTEGTHEYETMVLDTLDWAEPLIWRDVCRLANVTTIEEVGGGYGKGYSAALDYWRVFIRALERLQQEKGMHVVLLGHSMIKKFANPTAEDFDRYIMQLNEKAAGLLRQWANGVYFANYETFAVTDKAKRVRGVASGARLLYTQRTAAYDAKDRYGLPTQLPLSWAEFEKAARLGQPMTAGEFTDAIKHQAQRLDATTAAEAMGALGRIGGDVQKLAELHNWVIAKIAVAAQNAANAAPQTNPNTQNKES